MLCITSTLLSLLHARTVHARVHATDCGGFELEIAGPYNPQPRREAGVVELEVAGLYNPQPRREAGVVKF